MRVAMYYNNQDVRVEEMPVPDIGPEELLVRVEASGLCGSDVMEWYRIQRAPTVLGHEVAGVVAQVGTKVEGYREGDPVVVTHHVPCNACRYCLSGRHTVCDTLRLTNFDPGGFSEFLRVPEINVDRGLVRIPAGVGFAEASFTEPLACVYRGQRRANLQPGQSVLVLGSRPGRIAARQPGQGPGGGQDYCYRHGGVPHGRSPPYGGRCYLLRYRRRSGSFA